MFKRAEFRKLTSGSLLFASAPALASCTCGSANLDVGSLTDNTKALVFNQKEQVKVSKSSSSLPKLILYTFLVMAGLYVLGIFDKLAFCGRVDKELRTNNDLIWYEKKENELLCNKGFLDWQKSELDVIEKSTKEMIKEKEDLEKKVEDLKKDPVLKSLQGHVDIIKKGKNRSFLQVLQLRERVEEFWNLIEKWHGQLGFKQKYNFDSLKSHFEDLKWADEVLMQEENPLAYPEEMLKLSFEENKKKHQVRYVATSECKNSVFKFHIFENKTFEQLSPGDFTEAQRELEDFKKSNAEDYNKNRKFKQHVDDCSDKLKKFKKDFENFKKAKEKLNEIRVLENIGRKKICCKEIFGDDVELRIKKIVEAVEKIKEKNYCTVPLKFKVEEFEFGLEEGKEFFRYVFTLKDFRKIEDFISEVCNKMGIADKEERIEELERKLESENSYKEKIKESIANAKESIKKINKELESKKDTKERIEYLNKKQDEVLANFFKFTFPGKYTFFY